MKDMLYAILGLITALLCAGSFYLYVSGTDNKMYFIVAIVFLILTLIFGGLFFSGRLNKTEDIHITE